ncbi:MAG: MBL fold metallo-hydrolase [SAR202 cluster bacterium]|nr:MBL fold metallo-hydrolase [SAR202 cluster bacterium]
MEITWLAHYSFRLRSGDVSVLTDPYSASLGASAPDFEPSVVTISCKRPDQSSREGLQGKYLLIDGPGEYSSAGVNVQGVMTPLPTEGTSKDRNTAYVFEVEGVNVCHLGNLLMPLTEKQTQALTPVDVVLAPCVSSEWLGVDRMAQLVRSMSPKIVVPMGYKAGEGLEAFLKAMGAKDLEPQPTLRVTPTNLPGEMRVTLLRASAMGG